MAKRAKKTSNFKEVENMEIKEWLKGERFFKKIEIKVREDNF